MAYRRTLWAITILVTGVAIVTLSMNTAQRKKSKATEAIGQLYKNDMQRLDSFLAQYPKYFYDSSYIVRRRKFCELAWHLKRVEGMFAYLHPAIAYRSFLKPPQFEAHDDSAPFPDNWLIAGPFGNEPDSLMAKKSHEDTLFNVRFITRAVRNFRQVIKDTELNADVAQLDDAGVLEALRLQMIRMSTIGLANGDFVVDEVALPGLAAGFEAWADAMNLVVQQLPSGHAKLKNDLLKKLTDGRHFLDGQTDFAAFDRMHFLTEYLIPLSRHLHQVQAALKIPAANKFSAINPLAATVYDSNAFNADFFAPGEEAWYTKAKEDLGRFLFFDPILSGNNQRSCASCHKPEMAFTDGFAKSTSFDMNDLPRNAPTVINAGFQKAQFWDLRTGTLEDQLDSVINNPDEMHSNFEDVISRINSSEEYRQMFYAAFPESRKEGIQRRHVKVAIATYERALTGLNSRFDQYVRGDRSRLSASEIAGFNVYMGKAKCGSCHYAPLFSAALPPYFEFTDHRSIGVPLRDTMQIYEIDTDTGASKVFKTTFTHFSFKVPTVRNSAVTAPYMHNGVFTTLEQVIDFYEDAGGIKFEKDMRPGMKGLPFLMIFPQKLNLTDHEKKNLVAFIHSLTDTTASSNIPGRLPELTGKHAYLNQRRVGGRY